MNGLIGKFLYFWMFIIGALIILKFTGYADDNRTMLITLGAIALVYIVWVNKGRFGRLSWSRLVFAVVYMLFMGFTGSGIDNAAHVGGLIAGLILGTGFYRRKLITKESSL